MKAKYSTREASEIVLSMSSLNWLTNLARTAHFLLEAYDLVFDAASQGKSILIEGTKKEQRI